MVGTESTVACVMPHEFQGMSGEVTVALSSMERLRRRFSYPNFWYMGRKMLPVMRILRYWSEVVRFMKNPVSRVEETMEKRFRMNPVMV